MKKASETTRETAGPRFNTALLHAGGAKDSAGATLVPIYQNSAFVHESAEKLEKIFNNQAAGFAYTRIGNPTVNAFEDKIARLEGGVGAVACASGMAAVAMALVNVLQAGDEVIASSGIFGGTIDLFADLGHLGITTRYVETMTPETVEPLITSRTKVIFTEVIGNPRLDVIDIEAMAGLAHKHGILLIADSTTATACLIRPIEFGADIVVHSSSKYINGSGDSISGIIIDSGKFKWDYNRYSVLEKFKRFGPFAYLARLRNDTWRNFGPCLAPLNAYLNVIGIETLGLRMERLCENALALSRALSENEYINSVNYPGLETSPYYALVNRQFVKGRGGAILTFRAGSRELAFGIINNLRYAGNATNVGDVRTLVIHPASTIYAFNSEKEKLSAGVYDDLIRVSVGIEDVDDLIDDFKQAIGEANKKSKEEWL